MNKRTLSPRTPSRSSETAKGLDPPNSLNQWETSNLQGSVKSNQTASQSSSSNSQKSTSTPTCADENLLGGNNINPRKISDNLSHQNDEQTTTQLNELETAEKNPRKKTPPSKNSPKKNSDNLSDQNHEQTTTQLNELETAEKNPRKKTPPSKKRRKQGYGAGYIECKPIKRNGKEYKQYWYHYEFWEKGDLIVKKCRYIQEHLVTRVQKLEAEKAPVRKILKLLGVR